MKAPRSTPLRALLGLALAGSLAFGGAQAFASARPAAQAGTCEPTGYMYLPAFGDCTNCRFGGYCDGVHTDCICF